MVASPLQPRARCCVQRRGQRQQSHCRVLFESTRRLLRTFCFGRCSTWVSSSCYAARKEPCEDGLLVRLDHTDDAPADLSWNRRRANASISDAHAYKYDAAINIPIVSDVLAARLAGVSDENDWARVKSTKRGVDPAHNPDSFRDTQAGRVSVRFEPVDWFSLNVMYQTLEQTNASYDQVQSAALVTGEPLSGALIRPYDFLAADDQGDRGRQDMDIAIWNADVLRPAGSASATPAVTTCRSSARWS